MGGILKRTFDVLLAVLGLIILSPVFVIIAVLIKRDSPGPVFFWGTRIGRFGKPFKILKFRTMYENPDSYKGPLITAKGDSRITPFGKWLRDTKINELPQLWNVILGDMSLVGPRPEDPEFVKTWPEDACDEILSMRPGITSPASVLYRDEEALLNKDQLLGTYFDLVVPSKLRLDQLYVRNHSFWMDLDVLLWTFLLLVPRLGSFRLPEEQLLWGPLSKFVKRHLSWFTLDVLTALISFGIVGLIWRSFGPFHVGWANALGLAIGFAFIFSMMGMVFGVHRVEWSKALSSDAFDMVPAVVFATIAVSGLNAYLKAFPLIMVLSGSFLSFLGFVVIRYRSRLFSGFSKYSLRVRRVSPAARERVLIVGGGDAGQFASWILNTQAGSTFHVVGFVDDDLYKQGARIRGIDVLGRRDEIAAIVHQQDVGIIIFAIHNIGLSEREELLKICDRTPAQVVILPDILGNLNTIMENDQADDELHQPVFKLDDIESVYVLDWINKIEKIAKTGDLSTLLVEINKMKRQLSNLSEKETVGE